VQMTSKTLMTLFAVTKSRNNKPRSVYCPARPPAVLLERRQADYIRHFCDVTEISVTLLNSRSVFLYDQTHLTGLA